MTMQPTVRFTVYGDNDAEIQQRAASQLSAFAPDGTYRIKAIDAEPAAVSADGGTILGWSAEVVAEFVPFSMRGQKVDWA